MSQKVEAFERLMELREEMAVAVQEVEGIMRQEFKHEYHNAEAYWIAHIKSALGDMATQPTALPSTVLLRAWKKKCTKAKRKTKKTTSTLSNERLTRTSPERILYTH